MNIALNYIKKLEEVISNKAAPVVKLNEHRDKQPESDLLLMKAASDEKISFGSSSLSGNVEE